jgi:DNA-binding Lrp family transcriptional regulator
VVSDDEIIAALHGCDRPVMGTAEVADAIGLSRSGADRRLRALRDEGRVRSHTVGPVLIWWVPDDPAADS